MKIIKTTIKTYEVEMVSKEPVFQHGKFLEIRKKHGQSTYDFMKCFNCGHAFTPDEDVYLAAIPHKGNRFFCRDCADRFRQEIPECPHCGRGFFFEEIYGWTNRRMEELRREKETK